MPYQDMSVGGNASTFGGGGGHGVNQSGRIGGFGGNSRFGGFKRNDFGGGADDIVNNRFVRQPPTPPKAGQFRSLEDAGLWAGNQATKFYDNNSVPMMDDFYGVGQDAVTQGINRMQGFDGSAGVSVNPFQDSFQQFMGMQNDWLDQMFQKGQTEIADSIQSQFNLAGRSLSPAMINSMIEDTSDFGAQLYGNAFDRMADRSLNAMQSGAQLFDTYQDRVMRGNEMDLNSYDSLVRSGSLVPQMINTRQDQYYRPLDELTTNIGRLTGTVEPKEPKAPKKDPIDTLLGIGGLFL